MENLSIYDVIVMGGGQSGLSVGYYLRRTSLNYVILDREEKSGGSWQHYWQSLRLFSPAQWSSLPGVMMTGGPDYYPTQKEALQYIQYYESKYHLNVQRPVVVEHVIKEGELFKVTTNRGLYWTRALVSATGSFRHPYTPDIPGTALFQGRIIHSSEYLNPGPFKGKRVAVVGEGNSGAQILAEVSKVAEVLWITQKPPQFLPDDIDGRYLFDVATKVYEARKRGEPYTPPSLGDIVMVPTVKEARDKAVYDHPLPAFQKFGAHELLWENGRKETADDVIFCTGFKPSLDHLEHLKIVLNHKVLTQHTRAKDISGLWMVGYGSWTGFASATLIGVGRSAKTTVQEIQRYLDT